MKYVLYGGLALLAMLAIWYGVRFIREYRSVSRYMRRTKESGRVKSEIRRHRRAIGKMSSKK